jgi:hypothetical protein
MGWSCTKAASDALVRLMDQCHRDTRSQNRFRCDGKFFFFEHDLIEHPDGRITGSWVEEVGFEHCVKRGTFVILPGGIMSGGHPWMRMMCR